MQVILLERVEKLGQMGDEVRVKDGFARNYLLPKKKALRATNANREYFEMGVRDMSQAEAEYPGWLSRLLTDPVRGLENYTELFNKLTNPNGSIKVFCEVAAL